MDPSGSRSPGWSIASWFQGPYTSPPSPPQSPSRSPPYSPSRSPWAYRSPERDWNDEIHPDDSVSPNVSPRSPDDRTPIHNGDGSPSCDDDDTVIAGGTTRSPFHVSPIGNAAGDADSEAGSGTTTPRATRRSSDHPSDSESEDTEVSYVSALLACIVRNAPRDTQA